MMASPFSAPWPLSSLDSYGGAAPLRQRAGGTSSCSIPLSIIHAASIKEGVAQGCDVYYKGLRSPRRPLLATPHDAGVLKRLLPQVLRCFCLAHKELGGRRHNQGQQ